MPAFQFRFGLCCFGLLFQFALVGQKVRERTFATHIQPHAWALLMICELLGLPLADRPKFTAWAGGFTRFTGTIGLLSLVPNILAMRRYLEGQLDHQPTEEHGFLSENMIVAKLLDGFFAIICIAMPSNTSPSIHKVRVNLNLHRQRLPAVHQEQVFLLRRSTSSQTITSSKIAEAIQSGSRIQREDPKERTSPDRMKQTISSFSARIYRMRRLRRFALGQGSVRWLPSMDFPCLVYCHQAATSPWVT
jgi:hypothetical protein